MTIGHANLEALSLKSSIQEIFILSSVPALNSTCFIHLLPCFPTHRVKTAIAVLTPHLSQVQVVQWHLKIFEG